MHLIGFRAFGFCMWRKINNNKHKRLQAKEPNTTGKTKQDQLLVNINVFFFFSFSSYRFFCFFFNAQMLVSTVFIKTNFILNSTFQYLGDLQELPHLNFVLQVY